MRCNIRDFDIREEGKTEGITIGEAKGRRDAKLEAAKSYRFRRFIRYYFKSTRSPA